MKLRRFLIFTLILGLSLSLTVFAKGLTQEELFRYELLVNYVVFGAVVPLGGLIVCAVIGRRERAVKGRWLTLAVCLSVYLALCTAFFITNL